MVTVDTYKVLSIRVNLGMDMIYKEDSKTERLEKDERSSVTEHFKEERSIIV